MLWLTKLSLLALLAGSFTPSLSTYWERQAEDSISGLTMSAPWVYPEASSQEQAAFTAAAKEMPAPTDWKSDEGARFVPDANPQLAGPSLSTLVAKRDQTYTIHFREDMDRASVESVLKRITPDNPRRVYAPLLMHWSNDRQLHVKALLGGMPDTRYSTFYLDLYQSMTKSGKQLEHHTLAATLAEPRQLWRLSLDGKQKERLTQFEEPFDMRLIDETGRYLLLSQYTTYCECDATQTYAFSIYDTVTKQRTDYPNRIQLTTNYTGAGSFIFDRRGFFYPQIGAEKKLNEFEQAIRVGDEFVYGAKLSADGKFIIMATGKPGLTGNPAISLYNLATQERTSIAPEAVGSIQVNEISGNLMPIEFIDDSRSVYFALRNNDPYEEIRYKFDWATKELETWQAPVSKQEWSVFTSSSDGKYHLYGSGGFYEGERKVQEVSNASPWGGLWLPDTHRYLHLRAAGPFLKLNMFDVETGKQTTIEDVGLFQSSHVMLHRISPDGKWLYLSSNGSIY